jgi:AcrR family transcriptional regulator
MKSEVRAPRAARLPGGTLEDQLIEAALRLLDDEPAEALSLRRVAQDVGASHQAPYVHFGNKRSFLAAVAGAGLQAAADQATAALAVVGSDPTRRLHALMEAYIAFIRDRPHVHDLAYGPLVAKSDHPRLQQAAIVYWDLLHDCVEACQPDSTLESEVLRRCAAAWGTVYGIARLSALHQIPKSVPGSIDTLLHEALDTLRRGWLASDATSDLGRVAPEPPGIAGEDVS